MIGHNQHALIGHNQHALMGHNQHALMGHTHIPYIDTLPIYRFGGRYVMIPNVTDLGIIAAGSPGSKLALSRSVPGPK